MNPKALLALVIGYGAGFWFAWQALRRTLLFRRAAWWPSVRGRILESVEYRDAARNATHYRVRYEFTVGERIEGSTPRLCGDWFWNNRQQAAFVARYTAGQEVEVYHDPRDPRVNCLDRTDRSGLAALWIIALGGTALATLLVALGAPFRH